MDDLRELAKEQHNLAQVLMQVLSIYLSISLSLSHTHTQTNAYRPLLGAEATAGD